MNRSRRHNLKFKSPGRLFSLHRALVCQRMGTKIPPPGFPRRVGVLMRPVSLPKWPHPLAGTGGAGCEGVTPALDARTEEHEDARRSLRRAATMLDRGPQLPWSHTSVRRRRNSFSQLSLTPAPRVEPHTIGGKAGSDPPAMEFMVRGPTGVHRESTVQSHDFVVPTPRTIITTIMMARIKRAHRPHCWNAEPHVQKGSKAGRLRRQHSWCICYCKKSPGQAEAHGSASC